MVIDKLGFGLLEDTDLGNGKRWVRVGPGVMPGARGAELLLGKATNPHQTRIVGSQSGGRVWLFLYTDDFADCHSRFKSAGVQFVEEPRHEPFGTVAVFQDLYGNKWDLIEQRVSNISQKPGQA